MSEKTKAVFCWSGGKDSALALYRASQENSLKIVSLLTTLSGEFKRISMHGVREALLDEQAEAIGLPLKKIFIEEGTHAEYEKIMEAALLEFKAAGVEVVVFGDIFLEDLKQYREEQLQKVGMKAYFPLWKEDTSALLQEFWDSGFRSMLCCVDDKYFTKEQVGRPIDEAFLEALPKEVDPCGENGEFHSFCFDGPIFSHTIRIQNGEKVHRTYPVNKSDENAPQTPAGFWYCDLLAP